MSEPIQPTGETQQVAPVVAQPESAEIMRIKNERALAEFEDPFSSAAAYRHFMTIAETFARSIFVPTHFQGKPGDCLIALNLAKRMDEDPLQVMQNIFVVGGRPGFYTSFMIARANRRARFKSKIRWTVEKLDPPEIEVRGFKMPNLRVTALAVDEWGEQIEASVDTAMAIAEEWVKNAKYRSMPEHMLKWRSAAFLIRLYAPEVMMGMPTVEEVETVPAAQVPAAPLSASDILAPSMTLPAESVRPVEDLRAEVEATVPPIVEGSSETPEVAGRRGATARARGFGPDACPYPEGELQEAWLTGWRDAEEPVPAIPGEPGTDRSAGGSLFDDPAAGAAGKKGGKAAR